MYLGDSAGFAKQAGTSAASFVAKSGASYLATLAGAGSMAGPIGALVGGLVSLIASLFGKKMKDPVFGLVVIIPESDGGKLLVGRALDLLEKRFEDLGFAWGIRDQAQADLAGAQVAARINAGVKGAFAITSGGLPTSHPQVSQLNFNQIREKTSALAKPFKDALASITDTPIKTAILTTALPYRKGPDYYYWIETPEHDQRRGATCNFKPENTLPWARNKIVCDYDDVMISGGKDLTNSLKRGLDSLPKNINDAFIAHAGIDIINGVITDQAKADKAFKPTAASTLAGVASSPIGLLLLLGGALLVSKN